MTSTFLDSDSDSHHSLASDSSDDNLPTYDICSPEKRPKICQPTTATSTCTSSSQTNTVSCISSSNTYASSSTATQLEVKQRSPLKSIHLSSSSAARSYPPLSSTPPSKKRWLANSPGSMDGGRYQANSNPCDVTSGCCVPASPGSVGSKLHAVTSPEGMSSRMSALSSPLGVGSRPSVILSSPGSAGSRLSESPSMSPLKLTERHEKTLHQHNKLTRKVENLTANIKSRLEKKTKLEKYRSGGGIRGLSSDSNKKGTYSVSSDGEDEVKPLVPSSFSALRQQLQQQQQQQREADKFPLPLHPPGLPVLLRTPSLFSYLHPPTAGVGTEEREGGMMEDKAASGGQTQQQSELLSQLICDRWFSLHYSSKPCPMTLWEWLFQITCLSCDQHIAQAALSNLTSLLQFAGGANRDSWQVYVPTPAHVLQVLVALGADQRKLNEIVERTPSGPPEDVVPVPCSPSVIANLTHLLTYLPLAVQARPNVYSTSHLHNLIVLISGLSLDSNLLQQDSLQILHAMSCTISALLAAIPESCWDNSLSILTATLGTLSSHHHDCLHICKLLTPFSCRSQQLQRLLCRHCLWMLLFPDHAGGVSNSLLDWELTWQVIKHFHDKPSSVFDYYCMYSVICMLSILVSSSSEMNWSSADKEGEVLGMLANLAKVRIKDHPERTERVPVKDLLISFQLEMDSRKTKRSLRQMDLFSVFDM